MRTDRLAQYQLRQRKTQPPAAAARRFKGYVIRPVIDFQLSTAPSSPFVDIELEKKRKKIKNKTRGLNEIEMSNIKEAQGNEVGKNVDIESNFERKSTEDDNEERRRKKKKSKRRHDDQDSEREGKKQRKEFGQHFQNLEGDDAEKVGRKKRKKKKKDSKDDNWCRDISGEAKYDEGDFPSAQQVPDNVEEKIESNKHDGDATKELDKKKKEKKKKKKEHGKDDSSAAQEDYAETDTSIRMHTDDMQSNKEEYATKKKKKKKHTQVMEDGSVEVRDNGATHEKKGKKKKTKSVESGSSDDATPNTSNKKVRFSNQVDVFPLPGNSNSEKGNVFGDELVRGKRFTPEEDEIVKAAVNDYIFSHDLGEEGLDMVLNCSKHRKVRGCWKEIGSAIPYRPYTAVYFRAQILFRRSETRKWTEEEYEQVLKFYEEHGNQWKKLADELGKHRFHVKDTWRRIKTANRKKGHWSQDEYQKLFDLVNIDLQAKLEEEKKSKHGMLRDNICWTAISDELTTRSQAVCCIKWYDQLTSSMVAEGLWTDMDDYRLIGGLYSLDATCMEDVEWDGVVEGRSGDVCRRRWNQMVMHLGRNGHKPFGEQVEILAQRYCPHLLEAREIWDNKPRVP
ncbi:myb family transcription factor [Striga asiatica]|uniref:Myb family transcription factor n=1 Tax=Striga asiatica TaxID=4170 RepID=A0A5A7P2W6_STRAF|nr:myb family transcription factor [Striga asiatica]